MPVRLRTATSRAGHSGESQNPVSILPYNSSPLISRGGKVGFKINSVMPLCGSILPQSPGIYRAVRLNYQHGRSLDLGRECSPLGAMTAIFLSAQSRASNKVSGEYILANASKRLLGRAPSQRRASEQILANASAASHRHPPCGLEVVHSQIFIFNADFII